MPNRTKLSLDNRQKDEKIHDKTTALEEKKISPLLSKIGLTKNEIKFYLVILETGKSPVSYIARKSNTNRVNAYGIVEKLKTKGLIEESLHSKGKTICATPPKQLCHIAEKLQKKYTRLRWKIEDLIPELSAHYNDSGEKPKVCYYEGKEAPYIISEKSLQADPGSEILFATSNDFYTNMVTKEWDKEYYISTRLKRNCSIKAINTKEPWLNKLTKFDIEQKRQMRFFPKNQSFRCTTFIYNDEIGFIWMHRNEPRGITIKGKEIAEFLKSMYKLAWEKAEQK